MRKEILMGLSVLAFLQMHFNSDLFAFIRIDSDRGVLDVPVGSTDGDIGELIVDLERITGLKLFVKKGYIRVESKLATAGSVTARNLFLSALDSKNVYKIRNGRDANLGRVFQGDLIELDSLDQKYLRFRGVPRETFNTSMIFFHELVHRHLALPDPTLQEIRVNRNVKGPTVEFMNRIERELNLPERAHYFPRINPVPGSSGFCIFFGDEGRRIEIDAEMFRPVLQSRKNQGYVGLLRK